MDRSYLSDPAVIAASRQLICVRLTPYEDEAEMMFLGSLGAGRGGAVENTTIALLAPGGKTTLTRAARGPQQIFGSTADMAARLKGVAAKYPEADRDAGLALPVTLDARLGLDVAASDGQLLILVAAHEPQARRELEAKLAKLAWGQEFIGRFTYASAASAAEAKGVAGAAKEKEEGVFVIEPDPFGQKGKALAIWRTEEGDEALTKLLRSVKDKEHTAKNMRDHRAEGTRKGAFWETKLPVTDAQEEAARERTKRQIKKP